MMAIIAIVLLVMILWLLWMRFRPNFQRQPFHESHAKTVKVPVTRIKKKKVPLGDKIEEDVIDKRIKLYNEKHKRKDRK